MKRPPRRIGDKDAPESLFQWFARLARWLPLPLRGIAMATLGLAAVGAGALLLLPDARRERLACVLFSDCREDTSSASVTVHTAPGDLAEPRDDESARFDSLLSNADSRKSLGLSAEAARAYSAALRVMPARYKQLSRLLLDSAARALTGNRFDEAAELYARALLHVPRARDR
jgi:hypothetical protein